MNAATLPTSPTVQAAPVALHREDIGDTMVVLLSLFGIIVAALMMGGEHGKLWPLHPVWRVIVALAGLGMVGSYVRLLKLLSRFNPEDSTP